MHIIIILYALPFSFWGRVGGRRGCTYLLLLLFSSVQDGIYALRKTHMSSILFKWLLCACRRANKRNIVQCNGLQNKIRTPWVSLLEYSCTYRQKVSGLSAHPFVTVLIIGTAALRKSQLSAHSSFSLLFTEVQLHLDKTSALVLILFSPSSLGTAAL